MELYDKQSAENDANYLLSYLDNVLIPASDDYFKLLNDNSLKLHHAFSFNAIVAHAIDYMVYIAKKQTSIKRTVLITNFDKIYYVDGCTHINNKFELLDAVNNSFKHVELKKNQYKSLIDTYGDLSFHSLKEEQGKIFFKMPNHRFDYSRVVLRPISKIFNCGLKSTNDIDDFINGRVFGSCGYGNFSYDYEAHDAIDRMIDYSNAECMDCGENADECDCTNFNYGGSNGEFNPNLDPSFNFNEVMSDISGTREWSK